MASNSHEEAQKEPDVSSLKESQSNIQKEYNIVLQRTQDLEKYNSNLQDQVSKYAILLQEEKSEKREIFEKFENLQNQFNLKIESHSKEKIKRIGKYNTVLILCIVSLIILIAFMLPSLLTYFL